jgi:hypothetical protein
MTAITTGLITGIPALYFPKSFSNVGVSMLSAAEGQIWNALTSADKWGVYQAGTSNLAVQVDSVVELGQMKGSVISDYILETGSFSSFNKVQKSREIMLALSSAGTESQRSQFVAWLENEVIATDLFDIAMPEFTYINMTLMDYRLRRDSRSGASMIVAQCVFKEIRQTTSQYSNSQIADTTNAQNPDDQPPTPTAKAQPSSLSQTVTNAYNQVSSTLQGLSFQSILNSASSALGWLP